VVTIVDLSDDLTARQLTNANDEIVAQRTHIHAFYVVVWAEREQEESLFILEHRLTHARAVRVHSRSATTEELGSGLERGLR
jgi:hypothetical protein